MSTVDLYTVLNLEHNCTKNDIKRAYRKLVMLYHPDRPTGDEEMFELVQHAYNILHNPSTRKEYDNIFKVSMQAESDFNDLKSRALNFMESQKDYTNISKEEKEQFKSIYDKQFDYLDLKHGYSRDPYYNDAINKKETKRRIKDIAIKREQEDIESSHEKIFDDNDPQFLQKFNEAFELENKTHLELTPYVGVPNAWDYDSNVTYGNIDNYEDIYTDDIGNTRDFGTINFENSKGKRLKKDDVNKLRGASYVYGHNEVSEDYKKTLKEKMAEHEDQIGKYHNIERGEYNTDPSCGGYGIFSKIGINSSKALEYEDEDINKKYQKMLEIRRNPHT